MPVSDYVTVDEMNPVEYNWGYDPIQYNVPEGSYATNPRGIERIKELKQMIHALRSKGIRVVLDVVYNHSFYSENSNFNRLAPNYYYRMRGGQFTDGSGCGNEFNMSKPMMQKFLLDSLKYWMREYLIDGFRFDLMGLYDQETVDMICKELRRTNPTFLIYGEPWVGGHSGLQSKKMFLKGSQKGKYIAVFNDEFRDAVKGDNDGHGKGLISGNGLQLNHVKKGIAGEIAYNKQWCGFADEPIEVINYVCSHDNLILRDKVEKIAEESNEGYRLRMNRLAFTLMLMSFSTPFIHEGTEFYRTKHHDHNSYKSPDYINEVDWTLKEKYNSFYNYIEALIDFRQRMGLFNQTAEEIRKNLKFQNVDGLGYTIFYENQTYCFYHNFCDVPSKRQVPKDATVYFLNDSYDKQGKVYTSRHMVDVEGKCSLIYSINGSSKLTEALTEK
jgi:pullulanase